VEQAFMPAVEPDKFSALAAAVKPVGYINSETAQVLDFIQATVHLRLVHPLID
jgi:hypothetical protein